MSADRRPRSSALAVVCALVLGCAVAPAPAPATPPATVGAETPSPTAPTPAAPSAEASARPLVRPGEPWVLHQVVAGGRDRIALTRPDGTDRHLVAPDIADGHGQVHPAWSPTGERIALEIRIPSASGPDATEIWIVDVDGSDARRVAWCSLPCLQLAYPAWAEDGERLAIARYDLADDRGWGPSAIEIVDIATGVRRAVATTPDGTSGLYGPRWSPGDASLVLQLETYPDAEQLRVLTSRLVAVPSDARSSVLQPITPATELAVHPAWGPGERIVYVTTGLDEDLLTHASLVTIASDGSDPRPLTSVAEGDPVALEPAWATDAGSLSFVTLEDGRLRFATVRADGSDLAIAEWAFPSSPDGPHRTYAQLRPAP